VVFPTLRQNKQGGRLAERLGSFSAPCTCAASLSFDEDEASSIVLLLVKLKLLPASILYLCCTCVDVLCVRLHDAFFWRWSKEFVEASHFSSL
jgi:hypothetical protein